MQLGMRSQSDYEQYILVLYVSIYVTRFTRTRDRTLRHFNMLISRISGLPASVSSYKAADMVSILDVAMLFG